MSSEILTGYFPMLVPPNFCTSHLADGSMVFWCKSGGVCGGEDDAEGDRDGGGGLNIGLGGRRKYEVAQILDNSYIRLRPFR
jgi:hypothetical protein